MQVNYEIDIKSIRRVTSGGSEYIQFDVKFPEYFEQGFGINLAWPTTTQLALAAITAKAQKIKDRYVNTQAALPTFAALLTGTVEVS